MSQSATARAAGATAAALLSALYVNKRYGVSRDVQSILRERASKKLIEDRLDSLEGDNMTLYRLLELADPKAQALWFEGRTWTYAELKLDVDKLAILLQQRGVSAGDSVAVFSTNSPEMVIGIYAITKLGAVPALINTALRSQTLAHCMNVADAKLLICTPDLAQPVLDLFTESPQSMPCILFNLRSFPALPHAHDHPKANLISQVGYEELFAIEVIPFELPRRSIADPGVYIYTSGTTGKPKAVSMKNYMLLATSTPGLLDIRDRKRYFPLRIYSCLPMFHGTCFLIGVCGSLGNSSTLCIGRKFSASRFSQELTESGATRMLYVGELCRYLVRAPPSPYDKAHKCIVAVGNGLQGDIWEKFREKYNIPEIREFYRSTEGVAKYNNNNHQTSDGVGKIGFEGPLKHYLEEDTYLLKIDPTTEKPSRDPKTGFCIRAKPGEPGEAIGRVRSMEIYSNYHNNPQATNEKFLSDVFEKGDLFQRMGDLLIRDRKGWVSFLDRIGDTYRWQGENVSAGEVREHISKLDNVHDVAVYGVKLQGYDGQAGGTGIVLHDSTEAAEQQFINSLYSQLRSRGLTKWQIPRLIRIVEEIKTGVTFKHAKEVLKTRPWDPDDKQFTDHLYWLDGEKYVRLESRAWRDICDGRARL